MSIDLFQNLTGGHAHPEAPGKDCILISASMVLSAVIVASALVYTAEKKTSSAAQPQGVNAAQEQSGGSPNLDLLEAKVLPPEGIVVPVRWGNLGAEMIRAGVIDRQKFEALYAERGGLGREELQLLEGSDNGNLTITPQNSSFVLNLLWAFGLGNKNDILEKGPMSDSAYGGAGNFASTGGWSLAAGDTMDHFSRHAFVVLTPQQQQLVERVSQNIYRPCCGNSTYFPDCNHGMGMLGLLELMASQGISEQEMYAFALRANAYWFPDTYLTIAQYFESRGIAWEDVDAREILGAQYSSASGFQEIQKQVAPPATQRRGGGCGA